MTLFLEKNRRIDLSTLKSISEGGEHHDVTEFVHREFKDIVQKAFKALPPISHIGIDLIAEDISSSPNSQKWNIIEIDSNPSIPTHCFPLFGKIKDIEYEIIRYNRKKLKTNKENPLFANIAPVWEQKKKNYSNEFLKRNIVCEAAKERNLKVVPLDDYFWYIEDLHGNKRFFTQLIPDATSVVSAQIAISKYITNKYMHQQGIPVPESKIFSIKEKEAAWEFASSLSSSVIKPIKGSGGENVFIDIKDKENFFKAVSIQNVDKIIVEEFIKGTDYRIVVIDNKFTAAIKRIPAFITGDGIHSLQELINIKNNHRKKKSAYCK